MRKLLLGAVAAIGATFAVSGGAQAQPVKPVEPGTIVVHLNGYLQFEIAGFGSTFNTVNAAGTPGYTITGVNSAGLVTGKAGTIGAGTYKLNDITTDGDIRIYPGFDAETRSGIAYGAQAEFRTARSDANVGANQTTGVSNVNGLDGLYVKRAYGYIGSIPSGFVRLGQGDGAFTLLQTGVIEAFGDGAQFNSTGGVSQLLPVNAVPGTFIYADASALYATDKIVYISPSIAGVSFAGSYEPNSNGLQEGYSNCPTAAGLNAAGTGTTCADISSSPLAGDIGKRRKNTVDAMVEYSLKADGALIKASGGVLYGAPIGYTGPAVAAGKGTLHFGYDALQIYQAGAQATFAGLTVGGNVKGGEVEDGFTYKPRGARNSLGYIVGADYTFGPLVVGGSYFNNQTAGASFPGATATVGGKTVGIARTLNEYGVAGGANLVVSKNFSFFVQYLYGHRKQFGNTALNTRGNAQVQAIGGGATIKW